VEGALDVALSNAVPSADLPLTVSVAPFLDRRSNRAALAIVLGITQPDTADAAAVERRDRRTTTADVLVRAFKPEGKESGVQRQTLRLGINPTAADAWEYEILSRLQVPPGRYELRLAIRTVEGTTASVYTHVEVPDFADERLSVSGLAIGATPSPMTAPRDAFEDLMPVVPTARRTFGRADRVTAFLRAYQLGTRTPVGATVHLRMVDATDVTVVEETHTLTADAFGSGSADVLLPLPLDRLRPGEHLLAVDVTAGERTVARHVRIAVR
jgi:hypothetical protein